MYASFDFTKRIVSSTETAFVVPAVSGPLLLDSISQEATAGFSTRKLRSAYAGNCIKVNRSGDATTQDISFSGNELDTSSMVSFVVAGGGAQNGSVDSWYDQGSSARDLVKSASSSPLIVSSGATLTLNGFPTAVFSAASQQYIPGATLGNYISASAYTLMAIVRPNSGNGTVPDGTGRTIFGDPGQGYFEPSFYTGLFDAEHFTSGAAVHADVACTYPNTFVAVARYDGTTISAYLNGGTGGSTSPVGNITVVTFAASVGHGFAGYFDGSIMEVILFNVALSTADMNTLGANMATRAGVTWTNI